MYLGFGSRAQYMIFPLFRYKGWKNGDVATFHGGKLAKSRSNTKNSFFMYSFIIHHLFSKRRIHKDTPMLSVVAVAMLVPFWASDQELRVTGPNSWPFFFSSFFLFFVFLPGCVGIFFLVNYSLIGYTLRRSLY